MLIVFADELRTHSDVFDLLAVCYLFDKGTCSLQIFFHILVLQMSPAHIVMFDISKCTSLFMELLMRFGRVSVHHLYLPYTENF